MDGERSYVVAVKIGADRIDGVLERFDPFDPTFSRGAATLMIGASGSGKSMLTSDLALRGVLDRGALALRPPQSPRFPEGANRADV